LTRTRATFLVVGGAFAICAILILAFDIDSFDLGLVKVPTFLMALVVGVLLVTLNDWRNRGRTD
jgi:hypothetical protein